MHLRKSIGWLYEYAYSYNLFIPDDDDDGESAMSIKQQKQSTWLYVVLCIMSLDILFFVALVSSQDRTVSIYNITPSLFDELYIEHEETLSCPCSTIAVSYDTFVSNMVSFHPVCTSVFVSRQWIEAFYLLSASTYLVADFRATAFHQFELLSALCTISNDTVLESLTDIDSYQLVTVQLLREEDVQSHVEETIELVRTTAPVQVTSFLEFLQIMYRSNSLVSAVNTNAIVSRIDSEIYSHNTFYEHKVGEYSTPSFRSCAGQASTAAAAFYSAPVYDRLKYHTYWPQSSFMYRFLWNISGVMDGFFAGCFPLDAILASTLDCLYHKECLLVLADYFPNINRSALEAIDPLPSSQWQNKSVSDYFSDLFIDQWSTKINYQNYFHQCAPSSCTYITTDSTSFSSATVLFLSLYAGLTAILRLLAPSIVRVVTTFKLYSLETTTRTKHCLTSIRDSVQWLKRVNLFKSDLRRTDEDIQQQKISTRCFLILFPSSMLVFLLFTSLSTRSSTQIVSNPSIGNYTTLQILHPDTLKCPCSNATTTYGTFVTLVPIFHQVCSSDLIRDEWIAVLNEVLSSEIAHNSWLNTAAEYFQLLSALCQIANTSTNDDTTHFLTRSFATLFILDKTDFDIQLNSIINDLTNSIVLRFSLFLDTTRLFIQTDQPLIVSSVSQVIVNDQHNMFLDANQQAPPFRFNFHDINNNSICHCVSSTQCQSPAKFVTDVTYTPQNLPFTYARRNLTGFVAPGFVEGCFNIDSLLLSTLECFYNNTECIKQVMLAVKTSYSPYKNIVPWFDARPLVYEPRSTRYRPNSSLSWLVRNMFLESWNISLSFEQYYQRCAPTYCVYSYLTRGTSFMKLMITFVSIISGLTLVLRLITPLLIKVILRLFQSRTNKREKVNRKFINRLKMICQSGLKSLSSKLSILNIFPARTFGSTIDRAIVKRLGIWSTRFYIIVLLVTLSLFALHHVVRPEVLTKTFVRPSLKIYNQSMKDHSDTLKCPCSLISSPYARYVQIEPIFHQICSSSFVSQRTLIPDPSLYSGRDYRRFLSAHLQFLAGLCQLSIRAVNHSVQQSLSSLSITNELLPVTILQSRVDLMIEQTKLTARTTLARLLVLVRTTNHGNAIVSSYGTNFKYLDVFNDSTTSSAFYTQAVIYEKNCSCELNATCVIPASSMKKNLIIQGLKIGCTPSESFLASTLECFYNSSCLNLLATMTNGKMSTDALDGSNSRFDTNTTVIDLVNDLFVETWLTEMNFRKYFEQCSPMTCSYTYVEQLDSIYAITSLLSLYGGFSILFQWICPKIIYLLYKIYRRRRQRSVRIATLPSIDTDQTNSAPPASSPSVSIRQLIIGLVVFVFLIALVLLSSIYVFIQRENHSTTTSI